MTKHVHMLFNYASGSYHVNWAPKEFLPLNTTRLAVKIFPPKNLYYFKKVCFSPPPFFLPFLSNFPSLPDVLSITSRRYFSSRYQMSLPPLFADHGTRWTGTAEPWVVGPSFCPLDIVERIILILELRYELWGQGILTENFLNRSPCRRFRTAEPWVGGPSSYPLDHDVLVERIILELPDEVRSRGISTENILWIM